MRKCMHAQNAVGVSGIARKLRWSMDILFRGQCARPNTKFLPVPGLGGAQVEMESFKNNLPLDLVA
jgi:hypothetical protein